MTSQQRQAPESKKSGGSSLFGLIVLGVGLVAVVAAAFYVRQQSPTAPPQSAEAPATASPAAPAPAPAPESAESTAPQSATPLPSTATWPADLPPLPIGQYAIPRPASVVEAVYLFAARHPEILKYVPCYCGCELGGHTDNEDCFVAHRDAQGHVAEWETHALT